MITLTPCIKSTARINDRGYAVVWHEGKHCREHRLVYARTNGITMEQIKGLVVRHRCDNPACINPEHLEIGTQADNARDMSERSRCRPQRGSLHKCSKLVEADIPAIRACVSGGDSYRAIGKRYGVDAAVIGRIARGTSWSHVA